MKTKSSGSIETVKDGTVTAIKGTGDIVQATIDSVSNTLATTIKDTGKVGGSSMEAVADTAGGAIRRPRHLLRTGDAAAPAT